MPPRSATAAPRRDPRRAARQTTRPRRVASRGQGRRIRWDRIGRIGLLVVLAVVAGLYVQQGLALLSTRAQAEQQLSIVKTLARQNAALDRQRQSLNDPATIERDARALGMVKLGEHPYVVTGLSGK